MTALQLNAELFRSLAIISEDENLLKRATKYLAKLATPKADPTLMTKEEFFNRIDEAEQQIARGEGHAMLPDENLTQFLRRRGYDI